VPHYLGGKLGTRERLDKQFHALKQIRQSGFDSHYRDLADFYQPRRVRWFQADRNKGDKRNGNIMNSAGTFCAETLQSGLHAGLTSPSRPWMRLTTPDAGLAEVPAVKEWLHQVSQRMLTVFAQTNLYNALPTVYGDMGVFGTAAMSVVEDPRDLFRCYAYPIGSYAVGLDQRGIVGTFAREYELSVRQVVEQFGVVQGTRTINWAGISDSVKERWDRGDYEDAVPLCWFVSPNVERDRNRLEARHNMPWHSAYFETQAQTDTRGSARFLRESGFNTFPVMVPRWSITGEDAYATNCPGMSALPDVKQLQTMVRRKATLLHKAVDPALVGPPSLRTQKTSLLAADITYDESTSRGSGHGLRPIHEVRLEGYQHLVADIYDTKQDIRQAFYTDLFLMLASSDRQRGSQPVTAREIDERHEEKLLALGPVLERTNDELLDPLIDRVYMLMDAAGLIPEAPPELDGVALKVEYISIMSQAQKLIGVVSLDRFLQSTLPMVEAVAQPSEVTDKIDIDQAIENYGDMLGVDPRIIRSTEESMARRQQREQAQQAMAAAASAKDAAGAMATAGQHPIAPDSALDRILAGMGAQGAAA
jgi:hypothetical protein